MAARIDLHRRERPQHWRVREAPVGLGAALEEESRTGDLLLVDCLTLWTANCLWRPAKSHVSHQGRAVTHAPNGPEAPDADFHLDLAGWHQEREALLAALRSIPNEVILVTNEVGTSLVPENPVARLFRDEQGRLNQLAAAACDAVFLITAGLALRLK